MSRQGIPHHSLIAERRKKLMLSSTEMAYRLGIDQSSFVRLEQSERRGAISLASIERAAAAMGCRFVYDLLPLSRSKPFKKRYKGIKRVRVTEKPQSFVSNALKAETDIASLYLTQEQRVLQVCELSDLSYELQKCSKKP